ncbi:hypothetical protein M231_04605 [Tremella mesenterica]|uniref:Uncharacterized protein n=1 Tax=Tremella mesenterica TaxID=5217 RepID=A0A4Q1BK77_TREME|nr:hypothetical protein M231_04605 [Tremella mesenterica]
MPLLLGLDHENTSKPQVHRHMCESNGERVAFVNTVIDANQKGTYQLIYLRSFHGLYLSNQPLSIRDPHLRRNRLASARKATQNPSATQIDLTKDKDDNDDLVPVENPFFSPPSPTLPPSPKRGVKSNPLQLSNDVSHTGRLHTLSEKFLGTKKKSRPCPFCGSRAHGAKKCKTGSEIQERDKDRYNREMAAWKVGETTWTEGSVMGTGAALEKRLLGLQKTVSDLATDIKDRDERETARISQEKGKKRS